MAYQTVLEFVKTEHRKLLKLFGEYRSHLTNIEFPTAESDLDFLTEEFQKHTLCEESVFYPLYEKITRSEKVPLQLAQLKKEHASLRELISSIAQKQQQRVSVVEEYETFHVLLTNHMKNEERLFDTLDQLITNEEREAAFIAAGR